MTDITQSINYNYKTNVQTLTKYHDNYNASLKRLEHTTSRYTKKIGAHDKWVKQNTRNTYKHDKAVKTQTGSVNKLGSGMGGLALRFVGYNMVLGQVMGAQQKLIAWIGESITKFRAFEKKMAEVSTIIGDLTTGAMPGLTAGVESLSVRFGKSATDMAKGLYDILSAAFSASDAMRLLSTATKASIAGLADVSTSVDIFTSVLNAYGMTVSQAQHISDVFFQTVRRGKLVFEDLASALGYITPIASAAGVAFDEIAAILSTVTRMGLHVDMASRGLALTIQSIVSPTQQAADAARKYNVDMSGLALRVKGLTGFMKELNRAVDENSATILPEMIRNMRSLRVVMAVTSDEGIAGMTEDLGFMQHAAGQTESAMAKMTNVSQMQVDILANSMERLERSIGSAWSGVDMWWKKSQLWWGTLASGGDASKALSDFDERVAGLNASYLALFQTQNALAGKGTLMTELTSPKIETIFPNIKENVLSTFNNMAINPLDMMVDAVPVKAFVDKLVPWDQVNQYLELEGEKRIKGGKIAKLLLKKMTLEPYVNAPKEIGKVYTLPDGTAAYWGDMSTELTRVNDLLKDYDAEMATIIATQESLQPAFDYMSSGLDDLSQSISAHQTNIIELEHAMTGLRTSVEQTYTAMSGQSFTGKLRWQIDTKESEVFFDRFSNFSNMAIKYGDEFSSIEWFDEDIWNMIGGIEKYDGSMEDIINTMHDYSAASKDAAKETVALKQANDEIAKAMRKNNLEIMKIQLRGMMRRRGQTRSEERAIKKIEIENAGWKIDQLQNTVDLEVKMEDEHLDELKTEYDAAKEILDEYTDRAKFNLGLLKDIRDDEIADLEVAYTEKHNLLEKYTGWTVTENAALLSENEIYVELLKSIADRPETAEMYKELYGINASDEAISALERLREFQASGEVSAPTTKKGGSGGSTTPTPSYRIVRATVKRHQLYVSSSSGKERIYGYSSTAKAILAGITKYKIGTKINWKRGTYNVPEDGMVNVHKHEKIVPAGDSTKADGNGGIIIQNLTIDVKEIAEINDVEKLGALLSSAKNSRVLNKNGSTRFRSR